MTGQVLHHERLAWDAARVFVRALGSGQVFEWLRGQVAHQFGRALAEAFSESRDRLWASQRSDAAYVESGLWRARLEDLVIADRSRALPLQQLVAEASARLNRAPDIQIPGQPQRADGPRTIDLDSFRD